MKIWLLRANEDWVCDRFCSEWAQACPDMTAPDPSSADAIWLLSDWCWRQVPVDALASKPVFATVHHIVPEKFGQRELDDFVARDKFVTAYHVPCKNTEAQLRAIMLLANTNKPIFTRPFWVNVGLWHRIFDGIEPAKMGLRRAKGIPDDAFVIGSFQRDTEGHDLKSPKLEKGPDLFADAVIKCHQLNPKTMVLLAGWRRQYVISRLTDAKVPYLYEERPPLGRLNELYNMLDMYVVGARYEGGPQAIVECAAIGVPIVSRDVGVAKEILDPRCVGNNIGLLAASFDDFSRVEFAKQKVVTLQIPGPGMDVFREFFGKYERRTKFSQASPGIGSRKTDV